jgi:single-stranded-DNA-specific exonuclease
VLVTRGFTAPDQAKDFLRPRLQHLHAASRLADGLLAADRIAGAIRARDTILVHGDYDVDGICATALLTRWLRALGGEIVPFVPHRLRDGYDFGPAGLAAARAAGATLIVTVDCGTVAHETVSSASREGIDVVITDHHTVAGSLPEAVAIVNPQRPDCEYPDKGLCGTGVAYKICEMVADALDADSGALATYLDLVALATVADLVPLTGENRVLVHHGLRRFARTRLPGLGALLRVAGVPAAEVTAGKLGFVLAPRINAAGRIGESADALRLLLTDNEAEARQLAEQLDATNRDRQAEDKRTLAEALEMLEQEYDPGSDLGVVLAAEGWHPGVIGIVASRVVERIHRPVVLIALDGERGRGSARSIPGFHLYEALQGCSAHMRRFGGHKQAAGMDVDRDSVAALREAFNAEARSRLAAEDLRPRLRTDVVLDLEQVDLQLVHWMSYLGPHGIGNPGPLFAASAAGFRSAKVVGENHLKATLHQGTGRIDAIGFGLAERHPPEAVMARPHDVVFRLEKNEWRGTARVQARLIALRASARG